MTLKKPTGKILNLAEYRVEPPRSKLVRKGTRRRNRGDWGYINSVRWFTAARHALRKHECGALALVVYLDRQYGMGHDVIKVSNKALAAWGVGRGQKARTLLVLEKAGLIVVIRQKGRSPLVTIISQN